MKIFSPFLLASISAPLLLAQSSSPTNAADWPTYNRDAASTRYSPLTQINTKNVGKLTQAWSYALKSEATGRGAPRAGGAPRSS